MGIWVDTDYGFDDLWALLLLKQHKVPVDGLSLVAGNSTLEQVCKNAFGAESIFKFGWGISVGAEKPLKRNQETAERILGKTGIKSRGETLPQISPPTGTLDAINSLYHWADRELAEGEVHEILALGPLTNIAIFYKTHPEVARKIKKITWMGGSNGRGNHSQYAEFNALADPEALASLVENKAPLRIVDLEMCRKVSYQEIDIETLKLMSNKLLADLAGGYLDIALTRGGNAMSIYDPLAALDMCAETVRKKLGIEITAVKLNVILENTAEYGRTVFDFHDIPNVELMTSIDVKEARETCIAALVKEMKDE